MFFENIVHSLPKTHGTHQILFRTRKLGGPK